MWCRMKEQPPQIPWAPIELWMSPRGLFWRPTGIYREEFWQVTGLWV